MKKWWQKFTVLERKSTKIIRKCVNKKRSGASSSQLKNTRKQTKEKIRPIGGSKPNKKVFSFVQFGCFRFQTNHTTPHMHLFSLLWMRHFNCHQSINHHCPPPLPATWVLLLWFLLFNHKNSHNFGRQLPSFVGQLSTIFCIRIYIIPSEALNIKTVAGHEWMHDGMKQ